MAGSRVLSWCGYDKRCYLLDLAETVWQGMSSSTTCFDMGRYLLKRSGVSLPSLLELLPTYTTYLVYTEI